MNLLKKYWRYACAGRFSKVWIAIAALTLVLACIIGATTSEEALTADSSTGGASTAQSTSQGQSGSLSAGSEADSQSGNVEAPEPDGVEEQDSFLETDSSGAENLVNPSQLPDSSFIYEVSIDELASADSYMDGQTVQVTGEVVGDRIASEEDGKYCWITLQSLEEQNDNEVAVYMTNQSAEAIDTYGSYANRGTTLQVRGIFHLANRDHQGTSELQAQNVAVVSPGAAIESPFNARGLIPGLLLVFFGCCLMILFDILRERQR